ncbi:hypothetical protein [Protaetiibacter intestinalis]|uniref:Uncharacterized protein n=1 Tax=Protaetiibacter intestinalis TaxID=2419774 RepID=A0A387B6A2_9MICO|nr:hypothetical protein [Protaetiibacter intestinalis]AYF97281.1 hypothetical protein D7I47_02785 [Protaetiibacter intestinalis]
MTEPDASDDDDLTPEQSLALIAGETRGVKRLFGAQVPVYYFVWGGAWLIGYTLLWAAWPGGPSPVAVPLVVAAPAFAALILGAAVTSAVVGVRTNRGIKGVSDFVGTVYGISWAVLGTATAALGYALIRAGATDEVVAIYFTSAYALLVGAMYLAGTMLWRSPDQLVIALVMIVAAAVTGFFGAPGNMLAMALIAGPALLIGGVVSLLRLRRM